MPKKKMPDPLYETCPEAFPPLREALKASLERFAVIAAAELADFATKALAVDVSARPSLSIDILLDPNGRSELEELSSMNLRLVVDRPGHYVAEFGGTHDLIVFDEATIDSFTAKMQKAVDAQWTTRENDLSHLEKKLM